MKIKVNSQIGKTAFQFEFEERSEMETLHKAIVLSNFPQYCHECKNKELFKIDSNKDKEGNIYINILCKCGAKAKLGQYKTGGYFWHKFLKYEKKEITKNPYNEAAKEVKQNFPDTKADDVDFDKTDIKKDEMTPEEKEFFEG